MAPRDKRLILVSRIVLCLSIGLGGWWFATYDPTVSHDGCAMAKAIAIGVLFIAGASIGYLARAKDLIWK